jgi:hypothetical protein
METSMILTFSIGITILVVIIFILLYKLKKNQKNKVIFSDRNNKLTIPSTSSSLELGKENQTNLDNVTSFEVVKDDEKIVFNKINIDEIKSHNYKYKEIKTDRTSTALSSGIAAGVQIAAISALNPNGLFSATVTPQLLNSFSNGTFGTMIHGSKGIISHAGFLPISATVFAPIAIMQLMSMITGQYYLNGITKQLNSINKKIDKLITFHNTEKGAKLEFAQSVLKSLYEINYPNIEYLTQLKSIEFEIGAIHTEYLNYLENIDTLSIVNTKANLFAVKDMQELCKREEDSGFSLNISMVVISDEILHLIQIIELILNIRINSNEGGRSKQINELYEKISNWQNNDFYSYQKANQTVNNYFNLIIARAEKIKESAIFYKKDREIDIKKIEQKKSEIINNIIQEVWVYEIKNKLVEQMTTPIEILYSIDEKNKENNKFFIKQ